jgi:hypothetical protein
MRTHPEFRFQKGAGGANAIVPGTDTRPRVEKVATRLDTITRGAGYATGSAAGPTSRQEEDR